MGGGVGSGGVSRQWVRECAPGPGRGQVLVDGGPEWRSFDNNPRLWSYVFAVGERLAAARAIRPMSV